MPVYPCNICSKILHHKSSWCRHRKKLHPETCLNTGFLCTICSKKVCFSQRGYVDHVESEHRIKMKLENIQFARDKDFDSWKDDLESERNTRFVSKTSCCRGGYEYAYYYCYRSGEFKSKGNGIRINRKSCKINARCSAYLFKRKHISSGLINVEYCTTHIGHGKQLCYTHLPQNVQSVIATQLASQVEPSKVMDSIAKMFLSSGHEECAFTKLNKIPSPNVERHSSDIKSLVEELEHLDYNPIVFFKNQGERYTTLREDDFILCLQTKLQRQLLDKYGKNMICIDSTKLTTEYNWRLVTLMVVDDAGEAIPAAWIISNRKGPEILTCVFNALKSKLGDFVTDIFVGNISNNFYNAWCSVFAAPKKLFYCSWKVDRLWRKAISMCTDDIEKQALVYAYLKTMQCESDIEKFQYLAQSTDAVLKEVLPNFCDYFRNTFAAGHQPELWASCFQIKYKVKICNLHLQTFYQTLKYDYLDSVKVPRLDTLLITLLKFSSVKPSIGDEEENLLHRNTVAQKWHHLSASVRYLRSSETTWTIFFQAFPEQYYKIEKINPECYEDKCKFVCGQCGVCDHMYKCSCLEFALTDTACQHIHAVHSNPTPLQQEDVLEKPPCDHILFPEKTVVTETLESTSDNMRGLISSKVSEILAVSLCTSNQDCLEGLYKGLTSALSVGQTMLDSQGAKTKKTCKKNAKDLQSVHESKLLLSFTNLEHHNYAKPETKLGLLE